MRTEPIHSFVMYASAIRFIERPIEGDKATDVEKGEEYTYHNGKWSKTAELEAAEEAILQSMLAAQADTTLDGRTVPALRDYLKERDACAGK